jgi:hypothetical protein
MKSLLQPKYILLLVVVVAAVFVLKNQLKSTPDVLTTGAKGGTCPVHGLRLRLDTVPIVVRAVGPDSVTAAYARAHYPMANDSFFLLQWFQDDEHKNLKRAEVWYCPKCREAEQEL